ncbi:PREDICTED: beta-amylase 7-like isoform X4 [Nicotiana attenuata]|uniref:beta-amylase 7-like isoform X4 n=1 Tax=Nicotiana attenuata TaxID=49451 RepID=UPI00090550F4|nr:PREDICTED: beta-amylase 7-like isoform X4 [Nicotiana attenuata]
MASEMQRYDTNEDDEEMDVKEEDDEDEDDEDKNGTMHAMAGFDGAHGSSSSNRFQHHQQYQEPPTPQGGSRRCRPLEEKERTKLRERQRRAITAKILAGLRRHGNYNLRVRADINDVIAALAREAGWVVLPDGTTFPSKSHSQVIDIHTKLQERDFAGTPYIPVYVMLPLGVINMKSELVDADGLVKQLRVFKSINVDGVMVDCWWGIVEANAPQDYNWNGYKRLFQVVREHKLKIKVVMSFHECGGNIGDDVCIPLPHWVSEIGRSNPDIYFTDRAGRRNPECLSWGIDKERVLKGRTAVEVYFDYMRSFRVEFDEFFEDGIISMVEVGLGPCGELRYPSNPVKHGWRYPGVGEFQCYDQYLLKSLRKAAEARGHSFWARGPDNAGSYNSQPQETGFFCDGGDYDGYYGRFFLNWYSQVLVDHADRVLSLAKLAFDGTCIAAKLSGIHWWYKTSSHAAELTAGFYNPSNRDGYVAIAAMLKKHGAALNFKCAEMSMLEQTVDFSEALGDPEGLAWQVLNAAWDVSLPVCSENALLCHDRGGYNCLLEKAKLLNDPDGKHIFAFTYLRLGPLLIDGQNFMEFERFVKRMHGEAVLEFQS